MQDSKQKTWVLVGLGNPGKEYEQTRHNVGFCVIDAVFKNLKIQSSFDPYLNAEFAIYNTEQGRFLFVKPQCFMNNSGQSLLQVLNRFQCTPCSCLVITDNVDLPVSSLRLKVKGSQGNTHNGIRSIIQVLGTAKFMRLYVGIGLPLPQQSLSSYVLGRWHDTEDKEYKKTFKRAADAILDLPNKTIAQIQQELA